MATLPDVIQRQRIYSANLNTNTASHFVRSDTTQVVPFNSDITTSDKTNIINHTNRITNDDDSKSNDDSSCHSIRNQKQQRQQKQLQLYLQQQPLFMTSYHRMSTGSLSSMNNNTGRRNASSIVDRSSKRSVHALSLEQEVSNDNNIDISGWEEGFADIGIRMSTHFINSSINKKPVVLVVDDVASNRKMLNRLLKDRCSYSVDAVDGRDAVNKVKESIISSGNISFDVITMDYQMPVMDGPTATRHIRELGFKGIVIGVTGNALPVDMDTFLAAGANKVLTKPLDINLFDCVLREFIGINCTNEVF